MILQSNIVISFSAGILAFGMARFSKNEHAVLWGLILLFSTLFIYNLLRIIKFSIHPYTAQALANQEYQRLNFVVGGIGLLGGSVGLMYLQLNTEVWFWLMITSICCLLYVIPVVNIDGKRKALRDLPGLKIFVIAGVWSILCFYLPLVEPVRSVIITVLGFSYILGMTIPFDIRDLPFDHSSQRTIPQLVGWKIARLLSIILVMLFFVGIGIIFPALVFTPWYWITCCAHIVVLWLVSPHQSHAFYGYFIDGSIALIGLLFAFG